MFGMICNDERDGESDITEFDSFDERADATRILLVPEIANAIDDAVSDGTRGLKRRVKELTNLLAKLCSVSTDEICAGVREWETLARSLGYRWVEWIG
jgi:hypothetical protein